MWNPFADATKGAVEGFGNAIANVISKVKADPTQVVTLEADIQQAALAYQSSVIGAVNATMQAEAKSEHWAVWLWRPLIGFTCAGVIINNYILFPYLQYFGLVAVIIPPELWSVMLVVLGAAAAGRSFEKYAAIKNGSGNGGKV